MDGFGYIFLDTVAQIIMMCLIERKLLINKEKKYLYAVTLTILTVIGFAFNNNVYAPIVYLIATCIVVYILCKANSTKFMITYIVAALLLGVLEQILIFLVPASWHNDILIKLILIILVLAFGAIYVFVIKKKINFDILPTKLIIGVAIMLAALIFVMSGVMLFTESMNDIVAKIFAGGTIVVCLAVVGVAFQSVTAQMAKVNLEKEKEILQSYNEQQKKYYELVLKSEEDTRRFRHDMINHMFCLESYLQEGKIDDCKEYIANITDSLNYSRKKLYYTGNKICDVMLTNILENKKDDVEVSVTGRLRDDIPVSDFDLCIVVSNIVKNAVEAVNKQSDDSSKYIKISFTMGKRYMRIEERNSIDVYQIENAKKFETAKEDKKAHGLGVKNVKMIVEKYNGSFQSEVVNDEFYVCVEMDMKSAK